MNSHHSATIAKPRFFYGWLILPIAALANICTLPGQSVCIGAFNKSIRGDLLLSASELAGAYAAGTIFASLLLPLVGALMDRFGIRRTMIAAVIMLAGSCVVISNSSGFATLLLGFFLIRLFGQGALTLLASNTYSMWFYQNLGKVSGTCNVIVTICFACSPLVVRELIANFGWRNTYCLLGAGILVALLPPLLTIFRNRPEDVGQLRDGALSSEDETRRANESPALATTELERLLAAGKQRDLTTREAVTHRSYAILLVSMTSWALIATGLIFEVQAFAVDREATRFAPEVASFIFFLCAALMQFCGGILADKFLPRRLVIVSLVGVVASLIMLMFGRGDVFFLAYGLFGLAQGLIVAVSATIWVRYYGRTNLGKIRGGAMTALAAGSSAGPLAMGLAKDHTGNFYVALLFFVALAVISLAASLFLVSPREQVATVTQRL